MQDGSVAERDRISRAPTRMPRLRPDVISLVEAAFLAMTGREFFSGAELRHFLDQRGSMLSAEDYAMVEEGIRLARANPFHSREIERRVYHNLGYPAGSPERVDLITGQPMDIAPEIGSEAPVPPAGARL